MSHMRATNHMGCPKLDPVGLGCKINVAKVAKFNRGLQARCLVTAQPEAKPLANHPPSAPVRTKPAATDAAAAATLPSNSAEITASEGPALVEPVGPEPKLHVSSVSVAPNHSTGKTCRLWQRKKLN